MRENIKASEIYKSPDGMAYVINDFNPEPERPEQFGLKIGWYELGDIVIAPNSYDYIWVVQDGMSIPHEPKHFMTISEWRENRLEKIGVK
jgi:hypothetical protein